MSQFSWAAWANTHHSLDREAVTTRETRQIGTEKEWTCVPDLTGSQEPDTASPTIGNRALLCDSSGKAELADWQFSWMNAHRV